MSGATPPSTRVLTGSIISRQPATMILMIVSFTATVGAIAVWRVWGLGANGADLGFAVHGLAAVTRQGLFAPVSWAGWSYLGDHFSPLMLVMAPLAATSWGGYWLVGAQALAYGFSVYLAWRMAYKLADRPMRVLLVLAYATAPALLFPLFFDIHANAYAVPFVLLTLYGLVTDRPIPALAGGILACMLREDVAVAILVLGLLYAGRRHLYPLALTGMGVISLISWQQTRDLPLAVSGSFHSYIDRGGAFTEPLYSYIDLSDPIATGTAVTEVVAAGGLIWLWAIAVFLPWLILGRLAWRPVVGLLIAGLPYLVAASDLTKSIGFQYWVLAPSLLFTAAADGKASATPPRRMAFGLLTLLGLLGGPLGFGTLGPGGVVVHELAWEISARRSLVDYSHRAIPCIDEEATVAMISNLTPLTGQFRDVWALPHPFEALVFRHGEVEGIVRAAEPNTKPDVVLALELPSSARGYTRSAVNPLVWIKGGTVPSDLETCLSRR